jgi:hypothetical protein
MLPLGMTSPWSKTSAACPIEGRLVAGQFPHREDDVGIGAVVVLLPQTSTVWKPSVVHARRGPANLDGVPALDHSACIRRHLDGCWDCGDDPYI